jgi:tetratricopeptide (TPR) repeat protein
MPRIGVLALVVFGLAAPAGAAWKCRTEHFRVVSEPGPEVAQAAAGRLEAVRRRFTSLGLPLPQEHSEPVIVLVFTGRESLNPFLKADARDPALTRGLSLPGQDYGWIAVAWDAPGDPLGALAHEYAHLVQPEASYPSWFREGFAEYLAGLPLSDASGGGEPAAAYHLRLLREQPWIGWPEFLAADRMSAAFAQPGFYSQAWLAVHWLVARDAAQGIALAQVQPADLESLEHSRGGQWIDAQLQAYAERLLPQAVPARDPGSSGAAVPQIPAQSVDARLAETWELPYWKAEFHRELNHLEQARTALESLEREYPEIPEPSAALGALAIAEGRYDLAEEKLGSAVRKGSRAPATHHSYSLMLLRPLEPGAGAGGAAGEAAGDRANRAVRHARFARQAAPGEPRYVLGEAQALLVAGLWDPAARLLLDLRGFPGWGEKSDQEFAELLRRRQQAMRAVAVPGFAVEPNPPFAAAGGVAALVTGWLHATARDIPKPRPPARAETKLIWPPPGTILLYGYINGVECRRDEKIVTVRTPRFTIELRERVASPAKLYHPPSHWTGLPCGLRGREVNVVYRPLPPGGEVRGELVAVVF